MKVALVTGAARGLGFAWCRLLLQNHYRVVLTARTLEAATQAALTLDPSGAHVLPFALEVTNEDQLRALAQWMNERFGKLDLLVNNAGVNPKDYTDKNRMAQCFQLDALDAEAMLEVIHINSIAPLLVVKHIRALLKNAEQPAVVNISSWLGSVSELRFGGHYGYVGSKNLLNVLNKSMAYELKPDGIISVNVNPGWVQTDMGGSKAPFTAEESVANILTHVVAKLTPEQSGKFLNYDGSEHPW